MKKKKKRVTQKQVTKAAFLTACLIILVGIVSYGLLSFSETPSKVNALSASYLSLKNNNTTDMLKISNFQKLTEAKGISSKNPCNQTFQITGKRDKTYQIVLFHLGDVVEEEWIEYQLTNEKGLKEKGILSQKEQTQDGGRILWEGTMKEGKNWNLKMWITKSYPNEVNNIAYEIRIKESGD
ncbi:MAG: hypothetical protein J6X28_03750 [Bacilli bacterium]|nr:hypothetical protein [Bacilli bacterium]